MANPSRDKGTAAETALVRWLNANGWPGADRAPLRGNKDTGDITGIPDMVVSVKMRGRDKPMDWPGWLRGVETMRLNAAWWSPDGVTLNRPHGLLVVRRSGHPDPGDWYAATTVRQWFDTFGEVLT
jgi:hypothetical protein